MAHHKQQPLATLTQEPNHNLCHGPESISRMTQYDLHNKLGYVNCKGVLEYGNIYVGAIGNQDHCALASGELHGGCMRLFLQQCGWH